MNPTVTSSQPKSLDEVKQWFFNEGIPVKEWAQAHGFRPEAIYALLAGRTVGRRGQAHRAAVALGLKMGSAGTEVSPAAMVPPRSANRVEKESIMP